MKKKKCSLSEAKVIGGRRKEGGIVQYVASHNILSISIYHPRPQDNHLHSSSQSLHLSLSSAALQIACPSIKATPYTAPDAR